MTGPPVSKGMARLEALATNRERKNMRLFAERAALREDAARLIDELGGTASEVAVTLHSMGVRPSSGGDSPAARYLHAVLGADTQVKQVRVTKRWLMLKTHRRWRSRICLRLPRAVREFTLSVDPAQPNRRRNSDTRSTEPNGDRRSGLLMRNDIPIWPHLGRF
jgi:hypothetical protein